MSEIQSVISTIGNIVGLEKTEVVDKLIEWNKSKVYPVNPIIINFENGNITDNSAEVGELVSKIEKYKDDVLKNSLDAESVAEAKKMITEFGKFLIETRKAVTNPLKEIAGHYTKHEAKFKEMNEELTKKIDEINEKTYKNRERAIREYFESRLKDDDLTEVVSMDAFKDFIEAKRKTNIFTSTGKLTKGIRDAVTEAIRAVAEPILEAKKLEESKALQSKQFDSYMANFTVDGDTNVLEANINQLTKFKESVPDLYPDIADHCIRSIDNKIALMEGNIRANKAIAEKEAVQNADGELLEIYEEIKEQSSNMTLGKDDLVEMANKLREIYPKLKFSENQENVKTLGASISARVAELDAKEIEAEIQTVPEEVMQSDSEESIYLISIHDIEVLANMEIKAVSEEEAKKELVRRFEAHLSMVQLHKKGE